MQNMHPSQKQYAGLDKRPVRIRTRRDKSISGPGASAGFKTGYSLQGAGREDAERDRQ
jgi:hypothetical protein